MNPEHQLSPLDLVRQEEAEVARRVAASREAAGQMVVKAEEQARTLVEEARLAGAREGQAHYRRLILEAQDEVRAICLEGQKRVEDLRRAEAEWLEIAVQHVVAIIAATGEDIR